METAVGRTILHTAPVDSIDTHIGERRAQGEKSHEKA